MMPEANAPLAALRELLQEAERATGRTWGDVAHMTQLAGGSINRVFKVTLTAGATVVFKWHADPPAGFFAAERQGLEELAKAQALRVPRVYAAGDRGIVMEWLGASSKDRGTDKRAVAEALGIGLAKQHRVEAAQYGFVNDNFIGPLPQVNKASAAWIPFYIHNRLMPQLELAEKLGRMNTRRRRWAERLMQRLPEWIDERAVRPALLHGDLWGGNWLVTPDGPALIDPAVCYGDREMDLAMARLFGGFPRRFFEAYATAYPLPPGHEERVPIYQLYYLLIHLNLFGEAAYGAEVDAVLRRYGS